MNLPVLAAWLHDIGKFAQRAGENAPSSGASGALQYELNTDFFIRKTLFPFMPEDLKNSADALANLAVFSLAQDSSPEREAVRASLILSAGMETAGEGEKGDIQAERLESIFTRMKLGNMGLEKGAPIKRYPLKPLDAENSIFPNDAAVIDDGYPSLWRRFCKALENLPLNMGRGAWQSTLISLLRRYCWCVPFSSQGAPSVSLYSRSAMAAAICQALLISPKGEFLLYGGDLSGIQSFIFGEEQGSDKGAFRLLRARSFLLQAITRSVWLTLLERLKLDKSARIMDAGGRFMLLLPEAPEIQEKLDSLELEAEKWLLEEFQGLIRMNFARLSLDKSGLQKQNFSEKFSQYNDILEEAKLRPFLRAAEAGLLPFPPLGRFEHGECESCRARPAVKDDGDCGLCDSLKSLGRELPRASFIAFTRQKGGSASFNNPLFGGLNLRFYRQAPKPEDAAAALEILSVKEEPLFTITPVAGRAPVITSDDIRDWRAQGLLKTENGKDYFMGEECAEGNQKTFAMLAQAARIPPAREGGLWRSIAALGVCKADVDNLGLIFSLGFGQNFSLAQFAMLAQMLNQFFAARLARLIEEKYPDIYIVFTGGDDVFVIGPWSSAIDFAFDMEEEFAKFSGGNPAVSISCGIPVIKPGLPARGVREEAEKALEASKAFSKAGRSKNALTLFGQTAHWENAGKLMEWGRELEGLCEKGAISQGFVRRLLGYSRQCAAFLKGEKLSKNSRYLASLTNDMTVERLEKERLRKNLAKNALYYPLLEYDLARNQQRTMDVPKGEENDLLKIRQRAQDKDFFSQSEMGISWALYRVRS